MDSGKRRFPHNGFTSASAGDLMKDISCHFIIGEAAEVVMNRNPLAQGFMDWPAQGIVQVCLPAEDQGKAVHGVIPIIHQHLDIVQDAGGEVLRFIHCQKERLALLLVEIPDLLLDGFEHPRFPTLVTDTQRGAELAVELHDTDGGQADVFHVVQVRVQAFCETAEAEGFPHAGTGSKKPDPPGILQIIQALCHLCHVPGEEAVFFLYHLLVKGIKRKPSIRKGHQEPPPIRE